MKIRRLTLKNYRCFDKFQIIFPESYKCEDGSFKSVNLHVLLAPNMIGKSALLKALRIAIATTLQKVKVNVGNLSSINIGTQEHRVTGNNPFSDIAREVDIITEASFEVLTSDGPEKMLYEWRRYKEDYTGKNTKTQHISGDISKDVNDVFNKAITDKVGVVPLFLFIGTEYIHQQKALTDSLTNDGSIKQGYWYCLDDKSMETYVFGWFEKLYITKLEQDRNDLSKYFYDKLAANTLEIFKTAVKAILPDIENVDWIRDTLHKRKTDRYLLAFQIKDQGIRTYEMLSDGYRYLVLLIGEMVTRATLLNKHIENDVLAQLTGVILIDEFGIHLHPNLQSEALSRLAAIFPKMQFIVTTHSPLLINGLRREQLHIIVESQDGHRQAKHPEDDAIGLGAEGILKEMFGLTTTFDQLSLQQNEEFKWLLQKKNTTGLSADELIEFERLSQRLAPFRLDPSLIIKEEDPLLEMVKDRLKENAKKNPVKELNTADLKKQVNSVIDKLLSE
jgi:predicted ATP-binding protein involved in virulence